MTQGRFRLRFRYVVTGRYVVTSRYAVTSRSLRVTQGRPWERIVLLSSATSQAFARHVNHAQRSLDFARDDTGALGMTQGRFRLRFRYVVTSRYAVTHPPPRPFPSYLPPAPCPLLPAPCPCPLPPSLPC
jgi:hypothetical protein